MSIALAPVKLSGEPVTVPLGDAANVATVKISNCSAYPLQAHTSATFSEWILPGETILVSCAPDTGFTGELTLTPGPALPLPASDIAALVVYAPGEPITGAYPYRRW